MEKVGEFYKVSYDQFFKDVCNSSVAGVSDSIAEVLAIESYDKIALPTRATDGSAGYDFVSPFSFTLKAGESIKFPTGIRVKIVDGWWLACLPRSGLGFKYRTQLDNTVGVIDSDFFYSDGEGDIFIKLTNDSRHGDTLVVNAGDRFMQGIFIPYGITLDDKPRGKRNGGIGSTGK